jgi:hypothetical protein
MPSAVPDPTPPPSPEDLEQLPAFADGRRLRLDVSGLILEFDGLPADLAAAMEKRLAPFANRDLEPAPTLRVAVRDAGRPHYLAPSPEATSRPYRLSIQHQDDAFRLVAHGFAGWFRLHPGEGTLALCHGSFDPPERALENYMRACVAWAAHDRGGFLIHSASIVRDDGLAYLFFGASGAGKSTLAEMTPKGRVVSDDLTVVLPGPNGKLHVAGAPFRGTYSGGEPVTGLYPIHSAYRLRQDTRDYVVQPPRAVALADLMANLTFVVDQVGRIPGLADRLATRLGAVPTYELHFRRDPGFWGAIEEYHGQGS